MRFTDRIALLAVLLAGLARCAAVDPVREPIEEPVAVAGDEVEVSEDDPGVLILENPGPLLSEGILVEEEGRFFLDPPGAGANDRVELVLSERTEIVREGENVGTEELLEGEGARAFFGDDGAVDRLELFESEPLDGTGFHDDLDDLGDDLPDPGIDPLDQDLIESDPLEEEPVAP